MMGKHVRRSVAAPMFSPPEIITEGRCNTKADMWSLGVVTYILLCGYPPFSEDGLQNRIVKARYTFPRKHWTGVSVMGRDLVSRLLVLDVEQRYDANRVLNHPWIRALDTYKPAEEPKVSEPKPGIETKKSGIAKDTENFFAQAKHVTSFLRNMHLCRKLETHGFELPNTLLDKSDEVLELLSEKAPSWVESYVRMNREALKAFKPLRKQLNTMVRMYNKTLFTPPEYKQLENGATEPEIKSTGVESAPAAPAIRNPKNKDLERVNDSPAQGLRKSSSAPSFPTMMRQHSFNVVPTEKPIWIPDEEASYCRLCDNNFNIVQRRHHCRSCGQVVCESCSTQKKVLKHMKDSVRHRVCDLCAVQHDITL
eukprot:CAMPEP_0204841008 /NCGR_PEP_ID=MMETSP1346-20131115/40050_1 /ASSEMBLY_ACC=CAM_ASM_000771 /TAXON_ID=215587 /ORGANISM="Aplanochytrium stocchinoi, Strain GSBS06" /LENGTH=366 /DNA_ID=CAMNT_0051978817 /DNA_START=116 /DNA_END=1216 /DNA_ORIENTATION=-